MWRLPEFSLQQNNTTGQARIIKQFFDKMIAKFRKAYAELSPDQQDAQDIRQMKEVFDTLQVAFAETLVDASDNFRAGENFQSAEKMPPKRAAWQCLFVM